MKKIAEPTVRRLSLYLRFLEECEATGRTTVASGELARRIGTTSAQVRKDLSFFGSFGQRGLGYATHELTAHIRKILGLDRDWNVVIVGAGRIGSAMAGYYGLRERGFHVVGIFDADRRRVGQALDGLTIADVRTLEADVRRLRAHIAVLAVPSGEAQGIAARLARAGVRAILDFSTAPLTLPAHVTVRRMNVALELEVLSHALAGG